MKRFLCLTICMLALLCACGDYKPGTKGKLQVVVSIAPEYDWVTNILGDDTRFEVTLLSKNGADMHSYEPTADDIITISTCDVFVYVGGESDSWAANVLSNKTNEDMKIVKLMDLLGERALMEEHKEGMQGEAEEEPETDEHVWLSLKNAEIFCNELAKVFSELNPEAAKNYEASCEQYIKKLQDLDQRLKAMVDEKEHKTILVADRFPLRYFVEDYGIDYYAAFSGCSAESEVSFETITFLADKIDSLGLKYVFKIDSSDGRIANTIIKSCKSEGVDCISFQSMQNMSLADIKKGSTYLKYMEENLVELEKALSY